MRGVWEGAEKLAGVSGKEINVIGGCLDRHIKANSERRALVFENDSGEVREYSYGKLGRETSKFASLLEKSEVKSGSRIFIFLPKVPEMYIAVLGTIKHGSIAAPLFEAFQSEGAMLRLERGEANVLVTNKELFERIEGEVGKIKSLKNIFIVDSEDYKRKIVDCDENFKTRLVKKEDTSLMIFTSSTAGTPVAGVEIPHYGIVQQDMTARLVLDLKLGDNYWCTAHPGWVTGSVYGILAPLSVGCTTFVLEGRFDAKRWIEFIKKNKIDVIYTAPTALRMLKEEITEEDLSGVRNICSVGEALSWSLFEHYKNLGVEIHDSYWQTETGAMVIASWPGLKRKKGCLGKAIPGIEAKVKKDMIVLKPGWPAMMTGIYKHEKMYKEYFEKGWFKTNDRAKMDKEGYFFFEGRKDDIIKTSGERVSPLEIESALLKHPSVKESAVIGVPHDVKGETIKAFIILNEGFKESDKLREEIISTVKKNYAGHAYPKEIEFVKSLPKTNSGKIIRMELKEREGKKRSVRAER